MSDELGNAAHGAAERPAMFALIDTHNNRTLSYHRTREGAERADEKHQRAVKRANGQASYLPTSIEEVPPPPRRESLRARLRKLAANPIPDFLTGCPVGGWPETRQAMSRLAECLPNREERAYTLAQFIDATHGVTPNDRYFRKGV